MRGALLFCDPHCAKYVGLSQELAGNPEVGSRRGHGISPVLATSWIVHMKL